MGEERKKRVGIITHNYPRMSGERKETSLSEKTSILKDG